VRNVGTALVVALILVAVGGVAGFDDPGFAASMATAYVGFGLVATTLAIGPLNLLRSVPNPVSISLRRDIGIWAGIVSFSHVFIGLNRHLIGQMEQYFFFPGGGGALLGIRYDLFGTANWLGLLAAFICATLVLLSNNGSLRRLGVARWKAIQRWNYLLFAAVSLHALAYHASSARDWRWVLASILLIALVLLVQSVGRSRYVHRR
jgi:DMSO/TMAO reductase YedYZ heme-binding membrane subunit